MKVIRLAPPLRRVLPPLFGPSMLALGNPMKVIDPRFITRQPARNFRVAS